MDAIAADDPTGWFEQLYVAAERGDAVVPWDRGVPSALLVEWAEAQHLDGAGRRALVVGCGLGRDSEYVAKLGFDTVGFDISETAMRTARRRHATSPVEYVTADLFDLPSDWRHAYDLVVESMTIQSLPREIRGPAIPNVSELVAPGGTLIVVAVARGPEGSPGSGPPWPLTRDELDAFASGGVVPVEIEEIPDATDPELHRWRAQFQRPADAGVR